MNIESRLSRLERQNRLLRVCAIGGLVLAALPWGLGNRAAVEDSIRAKGFTLVDDEGVVHGTWSYDADTKTAMLRMYSHADSPAVVLDADPKRSNIALHELAGMRDENLVLAATPSNSSLKMINGVVTIVEHGKTVFVAPPKTAFIPVKER